jgi:dienelactone hydrolase
VLRRLRALWFPLFVASAVAATVAGCGGSSKPAASVDPFAYDQSAPTDAVATGQIASQFGLIETNVSFATPSGNVQGLLISPETKQRGPAVIYLPGAGQDRTAFINPALELASHGATAFLITPPSSTTPATGKDAAERLHSYHDTVVADVVAARRAVDVLAELKQVDPKKIGLVGWSAGALTGAILAGAEPRLRAVVLLSAGAATVDDFVAKAPDSLKDDVRTTLEPIDPLRWIAKAHGSRLLLQNGTKDTVVPHAALARMVAAAPKGTTVKWYDAGHGLNGPAYAYHVAWLRKQLGF